MKQTLFILMGSLCLNANGQQSVNAAGGNVQGNEGSVSFSIGQVTTNYIENNHQLNEGVQQPYEFFQVVSIENISELSKFIISPNPTSGIINLSTATVSNADIEVLDEAGRLIYKQSHENILSATIDLTSFSRGAYLLRVLGQSSTQLIKIIKN